MSVALRRRTLMSNLVAGSLPRSEAGRNKRPADWRHIITIALKLHYSRVHNMCARILLQCTQFYLRAKTKTDTRGQKERRSTQTMVMLYILNIKEYMKHDMKMWVIVNRDDELRWTDKMKL